MYDNKGKCKVCYNSEYKISFRKKSLMHLALYSSYLDCKGFYYENGDKTENESQVNIEYEKLADVKIERIQNIDWLILFYRYDTYMSSNKRGAVAFYYDGDVNVVKESVIKAKEKYHEIKQQELEAQFRYEQKMQEKAMRVEHEATQFYQNCCDFHIKEQTPFFEFESEKNKIALLYVANDKSLNFLYIDGYKKIENHGLISYKDIHYYEKAGNVHYVSEINGEYSSFGGSFTGGSFSKLATVAGGLIFGAMGMAAGAMLSYKPANMEPTKTTLDISSEPHKIDDRNVILNFYSESKKQFVDLELPQNTYNFLQTYLPEKKYDVVLELEKAAIIKSSVDTKSRLNAPQEQPKLPATEENSMVLFKQKVQKLKLMYDAGLLTDEEFKEERTKLLNSI